MLGIEPNLEHASAQLHSHYQNQLGFWLMSEIHFLDNLPNGDAIAHVLLAHGSMAAMDSPFLEELTENLVERQLAVHRFEFAYMAERRSKGKKRPPPRAEKLTTEYIEAITQVRESHVTQDEKLIVGGKSLGGRVASMVAVECNKKKLIDGVVCLGYPFHPPKKPDKLRTEHLEDYPCAALIAHGERDPFGSPDEIKTYALDPRIQFHWVGDGDHDFAARKRSGFTQSGNIATTAQAIAEFAATLK